MIDEAHALSMRVASHAHTKAGVMLAVRAGVDTIEHGSMIDEEIASAECVEMMLEREVALCPTLTLQEYFGVGEADPPLSAEAAEKAQQVHSGHANAIRLAREASVRIFAGTDSCNTMAFGRHARELQLLIDCRRDDTDAGAGCGNQIRGSGTRIDAVTGSLAAGKAADLLIVDGDPLADISLRQVARHHAAAPPHYRNHGTTAEASRRPRRSTRRVRLLCSIVSHQRHDEHRALLG